MRTQKLIFVVSLVPLLHCVLTGMIEESIAVQDKLLISYQNHSLIDITAGLSSYNRTTKTVYADFVFKRELSEQAKNYITVYKFSDNTYKRWAIQFAINAKAKLEDNEFVIVADIMRKYCRPPLPDMPKANVTYRISGYAPDPTLLPRFLSQGKWRVDITLADGALTYGTTEYYFEIKPKVG